MVIADEDLVGICTERDIVFRVVAKGLDARLMDAAARETVLERRKRLVAVDLDALSPRDAHLLLDEFQDTSLQQWSVVRPFAEQVTAAGTGRSFFCVGDVSGHGIPAALFMARTIGLIRIAAMGTRIFATGPSGSGHAVKALNNYIAAAGTLAAFEAVIVGRAFGQIGRAHV